jgi:hypothetical protein
LTWIFHAALLALLVATAAAQGQTVTPPPLPIGSLQARPEPGLNEEERKRHVRAHHHKFHHMKDIDRDDSEHGHESLAPAAAQPVAGRAPGASFGAGSAASPAGGAGTGPAREKTDRGASSWFYGNDRK